MMIHQLRARERRAKRRAMRNNEPKEWQLWLFIIGLFYMFFEVGYWWCTGEVLKW